MQFSLLMSALLISTALAAPAASVAPSTPAQASTPLVASASRQAIATPRKLSPATPPTAKDVNASVSNWMTSIKTVNAYLNDPNSPKKLRSAILFAKDEPVQLATLMKTTNMSSEGVNAGKVLMGNFGSIISNLDMVNSGQMSTQVIGLIPGQDATMAVNFNRCCTILPNIATLMAESMNATQQSMDVTTEYEDACGQMVCEMGVSIGATGSNGTEIAAGVASDIPLSTEPATAVTSDLATATEPPVASGAASTTEAPVASGIATEAPMASLVSAATEAPAASAAPVASSVPNATGPPMVDSGVQATGEKESGDTSNQSSTGGGQASTNGIEGNGDVNVSSTGVVAPGIDALNAGGK